MMNVFVITDDNNKINGKLSGKDVIDVVSTVIAPQNVVGNALVAKSAYDRNRITYLSLDEAQNDYINASSADWKMACEYIEHPRKNNVLILKNEYKDYILREMVSDIANYIQDKMDITRLTIGLVSSSIINFGMSIPVEKLVIDAKIKCKLVKKYTVNYNNSVRSEEKHEYVWIDRFPDIKSAVEHKTRKFEAIKGTSAGFEFAANLSEKISLNSSTDNSVNFYINYEV